jgi:hypothetical protein
MPWKAVLALGLWVLSSLAVAQPTCSVPKERWMQESDLKRALKRQGYLVKTIRIHQACYEVYGLDPLGRRVQILIDPATAQRVPGQ